MIITDLTRLNQDHKNNAVNKKLQNFCQENMLNDPNKKDCIPVDASKPSGNSTDFTQDFESQDPLVANTGFPKSVSIYGVIYKSIGEAAKQRNCSRTNILRLLRNHPDNCFLVQT